jgi:E3 SUMO-protein ligase NSE2
MSSAAHASGSRRGRRSIASHTPAYNGPGPSTQSTQSRNLPAYEAPTFSLNPAAQRAIADLVKSQKLRALDAHLEEAASALTNTAGDINDRLSAQRRDVAKTPRRRNETSAEEGDEDVEVANANDEALQSLNELQDKVTRMTQRMEEGIRKMIDDKHSADAIKESITMTAQDAQINASTQASTQFRPRTRGRRRSSSGEQEDEEVRDFTPTDPMGGTQPQSAPLDVFKKQLDDAKTRYQSQALGERYAGNKDYVTFKGVVHDAQYQFVDNAPDVPPPHKWFEDGGVVPAPGFTAPGSAEDGDDDDIAISRTTISTKCPLTLREFKDPLSSKKCNHSFESSAILDLIRGAPLRVGTKKAVQCPCQSCTQQLTQDDLHRDPVIIRKIRRIQRAKELQEQDAEEQRGVSGNGSNARNAALIEDNDDEEDGADVDELYERQTQMKGEPLGSVRNGARSSGISQDENAGDMADDSDEAEEDESMDHSA